METLELLPPEIIKETEQELDRKFGNAPPKRGLCRRCGQDRPINRLMLCYPCWVKTELEDRAGWREGMAHPNWCQCDLGAHARRSNGN